MEIVSIRTPINRFMHIWSCLDGDTGTPEIPRTEFVSGTEYFGLNFSGPIEYGFPSQASPRDPCRSKRMKRKQNQQAGLFCPPSAEQNPDRRALYHHSRGPSGAR